MTPTALVGETFVRPARGARLVTCRRRAAASGRSTRACSGAPWSRQGSRRVIPARPALGALAQRWLCGELEAEVALPVEVVCNMLGIDAGVLAAAVLARATP